jgi:hypothetical protein
VVVVGGPLAAKGLGAFFTTFFYAFLAIAAGCADHTCCNEADGMHCNNAKCSLGTVAGAAAQTPHFALYALPAWLEGGTWCNTI